MEKECQRKRKKGGCRLEEKGEGFNEVKGGGEW